MTTAEQLINAARELSNAAKEISFSHPAAIVYNPLEYAWKSHSLYLERFGDSRKKVVFLGMNPGPWGMVQTGVPFGEIDAVKNWLGIEATVEKPAVQHPKRPITGFHCHRSEVSGKRLWGLFKERFGHPGNFFNDHFVANYCPLAFIEASSRNRTPDKLKPDERRILFQVCDLHLAQVIQTLEPEWVIGVGRFTYQCILRVLENADTSMHLPTNVQAASILHPSPASPAANKDWAGTVTRQLIELEIWV
jgi:single-strand selective monofunctional uracil DNA glycosylase